MKAGNADSELVCAGGSPTGSLVIWLLDDGKITRKVDQNTVIWDKIFQISCTQNRGFNGATFYPTYYLKTFWGLSAFQNLAKSAQGTW